MLAVSKAKLIAERERIKNLESEFNLKILHAGRSTECPPVMLWLLTDRICVHELTGDAVNFPKPGDTVSV